MSTLDCLSRDEMTTLVRTNLRGIPKITIRQAEHISGCLVCATWYMDIYTIEDYPALTRDVEAEQDAIADHENAIADHET